MSGSPRAIAVVTVARSDWGHLRPVLGELRAAQDVRLLLFAGGMHLAEAFGRTVAAIEAEGWPIAERVEMLEPSDSPEAIATSIGRGVAGFGRAYARHRPDLVVVLGDRFEMLAAATAALPFVLPVAHLHGGEVTEGAIDNQIRHAITKCAHLHFVSAEPHARRVAAMGEEPWRIHNVGAPGLDRVRTTPLLSRAELARRLALCAADRWLLVTYHPATLEYQDTGRHVDELLAALEKVDATLVVTYPNADTAGRTVMTRLEEFAGRHARVRLARNLGDDVYLSILRHADAMVGNSSSGLIEAPSFELPVVNVGARQAGRLRAANVVDVGPERDEILAGIEAALAPGFRAGLRGLVNPYGDGRAAERVVRVLRTVELGPALTRKREGA
jgi:UDP-hydrolysing UDP-N-acetyl-D-glucosamine 2-epimerase